MTARVYDGYRRAVQRAWDDTIHAAVTTAAGIMVNDFDAESDVAELADIAWDAMCEETAIMDVREHADVYAAIQRAVMDRAGLGSHVSDGTPISIDTMRTMMKGRNP